MGAPDSRKQPDGVFHHLAFYISHVVSIRCNMKIQYMNH